MGRSQANESAGRAASTDPTRRGGRQVAASAGGGPGPGGIDPNGTSDDGLSDQYVDLFQLAANRLADAVLGLVAVLRGNPLVAAAFAAAGLGALVGLGLAKRSRSRAAAAAQAAEEQAEALAAEAGSAVRRGGRFGRLVYYGEIVPLVMRLLENPIVRGYLVRSLSQRVSKRFG